jgi:hypothetical protein
MAKAIVAGISAAQRRTLFAARKNLAWGEDEHQLVMERVGVPAGPDGRRSTKVMTRRQWEAYVRHAQECGFAPQFGPVPEKERPSRAQMFRLGELKNAVVAGRIVGGSGTEDAARFAQGVVAKATKGWPLSWWTPADAVRAIQSLEDVAGRLTGSGAIP